MTIKYHNSNFNVNALASPSRSRWLVLHSPTFNLSEFGSFLPLVLWTSPKNFTLLAHGFQGFLGSPSLEPLAIGWSPERCMVVVILLSIFFAKYSHHLFATFLFWPRWVFRSYFRFLIIQTLWLCIHAFPALFHVSELTDELWISLEISQGQFLTPTPQIQINTFPVPQRLPRFLYTFTTLYLSKLTWPTPSTTSLALPLPPSTLPILYVRCFWYFIAPSAYPSIIYVC